MTAIIDICRIAGTRTYTCSLDRPEEISLEIFGRDRRGAADAADASIRALLARSYQVTWGDPVATAGSDWSVTLAVRLA